MVIFLFIKKLINSIQQIYKGLLSLLQLYNKYFRDFLLKLYIINPSTVKNEGSLVRSGDILC